MTSSLMGDGGRWGRVGMGVVGWAGNGAGVRLKWILVRLIGIGGCSKCSERPILFIKKNWICAMTRRHAEPNDILLTRNLLFDSDVRQ